MVKRIVVWTETAARQRREVLKYWTIRNGSDEYARKLIKITRDRIKVIEKYPESGVETDYAETRMSAMGHFSLYYKVTYSNIFIVAFWDNRQDPAILLELIKNKNSA
jgi:plasmid stabilization system protein ParE